MNGNVEQELRERAEGFASGKYHWVQGTPHEINERCLVVNIDHLTECKICHGNAPHTVPVIQEISPTAFQVLRDTLAELEGKPYNLIDWNDTQGRQKDEVIALLEKGAAKAGEKGV